MHAQSAHRFARELDANQLVYRKHFFHLSRRSAISLSLFLSVNPRFFPVIKLDYARVGPIKLALNSIPNSKDTDDRCYLFANSAASKMPLDKCLTRLGAYGYSEYDITGEIAYSRVPIKT